MTTTASPSRAERVVAYGFTSSLFGFQNFLFIPVALALVDPSHHGAARVAVIVAFGTVTFAGVLGACRALDDLAGATDGSDEANYRASDASGGRPAYQKPLVTGVLSRAEVVRFAQVAAVTAGIGLVGAWGAAEWSPRWFPIPVLIVALCASQYSVGLRLSYRPLGLEMVLVLAFAAPLALGVLLASGSWSTAAAVQGLAFGAWQAQISLVSNIHDIGGDGAAGRQTLAVHLPLATYERVDALVLVGVWAALFVATAIGWLAADALAACAGALALQVWSLVLLGRDDVLGARRLRFAAVTVGMLGLLVADVVGGRP